MSGQQPRGVVTFAEAMSAEDTLLKWAEVTTHMGMVPVLCVCTCRQPDRLRHPMLPHAAGMTRAQVRALLVQALAALDSPDAVECDGHGRVR